MAVILDNRIQRSEDALVILSFSEEDKYAPRNSFLHGDVDYTISGHQSVAADNFVCLPGKL